MDALQTIRSRMQELDTAPALYWHGNEYDYASLCEMIDRWKAHLGQIGVTPGTVCGILGDFSPGTCSLMFALLEARAVLVPLTRAIEAEMPAFMEMAGVEHLFSFHEDDTWTVRSIENPSQNALVRSFRARGTPGLIVFTSGSTGRPKGILHDVERVARKFVKPRAGWRTVLFLLMDHLGGFNTFLSTFAYGGVGVCAAKRTPDAVCQAIAEAGATLLPTTPSFLSLLIASGSYRGCDLSSVQLITYGTEVMPETTLHKVREIFPQAQVKQTYGLSELGVLRSKSEHADSVWVKIGGDGFEVKIVDGLLWIRSEANMVGYLNADSPFDADGWMCTGDHVEVRGEYMRILGRKSDVINVGGQKVFPVEVETVLLQAENVREVAVHGAPHPLLGQVVHARVALEHPEDVILLRERLRAFCMERLSKSKVPVRLTVVPESELLSQRFKRVRQQATAETVVPDLAGAGGEQRVGAVATTG